MLGMACLLTGLPFYLPARFMPLSVGPYRFLQYVHNTWKNSSRRFALLEIFNHNLGSCSVYLNILCILSKPLFPNNLYSCWIHRIARVHNKCRAVGVGKKGDEILNRSIQCRSLESPSEFSKALYRAISTLTWWSLDRLYLTLRLLKLSKMHISGVSHRLLRDLYTSAFIHSKCWLHIYLVGQRMPTLNANTNQLIQHAPQKYGPQSEETDTQQRTSLYSLNPPSCITSGINNGNIQNSIHN